MCVFYLRTSIGSQTLSHNDNNKQTKNACTNNKCHYTKDRIGTAINDHIIIIFEINYVHIGNITYVDFHFSRVEARR